jgi:ribosomal protein S6--L-glutamate ligase
MRARHFRIGKPIDPGRATIGRVQKLLGEIGRGSKGAVAAREARPLVMGWVEYVSFPEWHVEAVEAKVDTGARISALHVDSVRKLSDGRIRFEIVLHAKQRHLRVTADAKVLRRSRIRSSNGQYEERFVVPAMVRIGDVERTIEISLVSRTSMTYRMLLGRDALAGYLIDPARRDLLGGPKREVVAPRPKVRPAGKTSTKRKSKP